MLEAQAPSAAAVARTAAQWRTQIRSCKMQIRTTSVLFACKYEPRAFYLHANTNHERSICMQIRTTSLYLRANTMFADRSDPYLQHYFIVANKNANTSTSAYTAGVLTVSSSRVR